MRFILTASLLFAFLTLTRAAEDYEQHVKNLAAGTPEKDLTASLRTLKDMGTAAFPTLCAHLEDQSPAEPRHFQREVKYLSPPETPRPDPPTIGDACFDILQGKIEVECYAGFSEYFVLTPANVKAWLDARPGFTLGQLRRDALEESLRRAEKHYPERDFSLTLIRRELENLKYGERYESSLPPEFASYHFLLGSISPDEKHGILYPRRSELVELMDENRARLVLVRLPPIEVLADIPIGHSNLTLTPRDSYSVEWTRDSSAFLMLQGMRWGPERVYLGELNPDGKPRFTDIAALVAKQVRPDFKRSGAKPYNDYYEFEFDEEERKDESGKVIDAWHFTGDGNVRINCICTTDPKGDERNRWTVNWSGVWERKSQRFSQVKSERLWPKPR